MPVEELGIAGLKRMERSVKKALWLSCGLVFLILATEPVGIRSQFVIGVAALLGMAAIRALDLTGVWRQIFLALGTAVVIRYFFWRSVNTLPLIPPSIYRMSGI